MNKKQKTRNKKLLLLSTIVLLTVIFALFLASNQAPEPVKAQTFPFSCINPTYATSPVCIGEHPRLYITAETLPTIRERARTTHLEEYQDLLNKARSRYTMLYNNDYEIYRSLVMFALLYQLGEIAGFSYTHTPQEYGAKAAQLVEQFADMTLNNAKANEHWSSYQTHCLSIGYDWLNELLTTEVKSKIFDAIIHLRDNTASGDKGDTFATGQRQVIIGGLAFHGDGVNNAKAQEYVGLFQPLWVEGILAAQELISNGVGGHDESYGYSTTKVGSTTQVLEAWRTATGENPYINSSWFRYYPYWLIYTSRARATRHNFEVEPYWRPLKTGDSTYSAFGSGRGCLPLYLMASVNQELGDTDLASLTTWFIQNRLSSYFTNKIENIPWRLIWYDKSIIVKSPSELKLPLTRYFSGSPGQVLMRTGFENEDDVVVSFIDQPYVVATHNQPHQNSFVIEKRGELALDSGVYENQNTTHDWNYGRQTIAHNTITIYNPDETFPGSVGTNDGGQRPIGKAMEVEDIVPGSRWDVGEIARFETEPNEYDYILGDATRAYNSTLVTSGSNSPKISNFTRQFIYLRPQLTGGDDVFVVFDRVSSTNPDFKKKWLLHMPFEPAINGNSWQDATYNWHTIYDGDTLEFDGTTHESKLFSRTLLPESHTITKIGGPGHEFEDAEGNNWPISNPAYYEDWMGAWRVEVEPATAQTEDVFLHVLQTADTGVAQMYQTDPVEVTTNNMAGAQITTPSAIQVVMFSTTETTGLEETIIYNLSGQGTSKHLITDLKPNTQFTVTNTNQDTGQVVQTQTKTSSDQGTLYFTTLLGSNHQIAITPGTTPSPQPPTITLTKSVLVNGQSSTQASQGDELTYTINYRDPSTSSGAEARNIVITDTIPNGTTYVAGSCSPGCQFNGSQVSWTIPSLPAGGQGSVSFKVIVE